MVRKSWEVIEASFLRYYKTGRNNIDHEGEIYLERLGFIEDGEITDRGESYLDAKFLRKNQKHKDILKNALLELDEINSICQFFYGQKKDIETVRDFFRSKTSLGRFQTTRPLILMDEADLVDFERKGDNSTVTFKEFDDLKDKESYKISRETPYSNVKRLRRAIRSCEGKITWIDKHFSKKGLEPLSDEIIHDKFDEVKILCGPSNVNHHLRSDFERFKDEMNKRDIHAELRVIVKREYLKQIHDRWIISDTISWNMPPINSLYQNQESEIHQTPGNVDYDVWWDNSKEIISEWNKIQKHI